MDIADEMQKYDTKREKKFNLVSWCLDKLSKIKPISSLFIEFVVPNSSKYKFGNTRKRFLIENVVNKVKFVVPKTAKIKKW